MGLESCCVNLGRVFQGEINIVRVGIVKKEKREKQQWHILTQEINTNQGIGTKE